MPEVDRKSIFSAQKAAPVSWSSPPRNSMPGQDQCETETMPVDRATGEVGDVEHQQEPGVERADFNSTEINAVKWD